MEKRVLIIDLNHMVHTYLNSQYRLTKTITVNGYSTEIDTTAQSGVIKAIHRWSKNGYYPTAVCFDSPVPARKSYFAKEFGMPVDSDKAYKGGRKRMPDSMFETIRMIQDILTSSGVCCYKADNYEADDLIFACIQRAKKDYPGMPIDVVTNDADLLPLVDEQVSVFIRSKKRTWAESPDLEKLHYVQVTPKNYQEVVEDLSAYRKFLVPYNTLLFHKLVRGDSSDNITNIIKKKFPPTKYNALIEELFNLGIDFSNIFRYGACKETLVSISTGKEVDESHDRSDMAVRYDDPQELTDMMDLLCWFLDEESLQYIKKMYKGMNLNQAYANLGPVSRRPAKLSKGIVPFDECVLQSKVAPLGIRLRLDI